MSRYLRAKHELEEAFEETRDIKLIPIIDGLHKEWKKGVLGGVILETAKKNLKCPNGCGELVEIKNPPAIDTELYRELSGKLHHLFCGASANTGVAFLLEAVCPICGYVSGRDINEEELEKVLKKPIASLVPSMERHEFAYITTNLPDHYKFHDDYFNEEVVVKSFPYMDIFGDFRLFNGLTLREFDDFLAKLVPIFIERKEIADRVGR